MARRAIEGIRGIVTGASGGIGRAIASELVRQGARIVVTARRREKLLELAAELGGAAARLEVVDGDITSPALRQQLVERAVVAFGGLDLVVNNAGIGALGRFAQADPQRLRKIMEVNFFAAAEMIRASVPALARGNQPMIVNISSVLGHRGIPHASEYCASKFAVQGMSESLRAELARQGIDLLVVSPGTTETEFFEHAIEKGEYPWSQQPGVSAAYVAKRTVRAIRSGRHEIILNARGKLLVWANRLFPRLVDGFLARYG